MTLEDFISLKQGDTIYVCTLDADCEDPDNAPCPPKEVIVKELGSYIISLGDNLDVEYAEEWPTLTYYSDKHNSFKTLQEAQDYYTWQCSAYCRSLLAQALEVAITDNDRNALNTALNAICFINEKAVDTL